MSRSPSILFLAPQLYGAPGGVQSYMRRLREILTAYSKDRRCQVHCLSLNDAAEDRELHPQPVQGGTFEGCSRKKVAFVLKAVIQGLRRPNSAVVVGHIGQAPVAWLLQKVGLICSYILVLHGIEAWKKVAWLDGLAARGAAVIVATTHYTGQEFGKHNGVAADRFRVIPLSLAAEQITAPAGNQRNNGELDVLSVGRLSTGDRPKGIDTLIEAVGKCQNDNLKINLTVAGDGDDLPRLRSLAERLGLKPQVSFVGAVSDDRLLELYQDCDVFAMPSKKEGFGIVFLEAMRYGKPCIGGNHGGTPEVIDHGVGGYLVDHGDVEQLAQYLIEFHTRPALRYEMGLKGYEKVKSKYLSPYMRDNWFSLLDQLAGKC